jgi:hypothetical protein
MGLRHKPRRHARDLLAPGESIDAVFGAQTVSPWWKFLSYSILMLAGGYRADIVTDRRILVCRCGRLRSSALKEVLAELPGQTVIGPLAGMWSHTEALGERLYVYRRFYKDVDDADARFGGGGWS